MLQGMIADIFVVEVNAAGYPLLGKKHMLKNMVAQRGVIPTLFHAKSLWQASSPGLERSQSGTAESRFAQTDFARGHSKRRHRRVSHPCPAERL